MVLTAFRRCSALPGVLRARITPNGCDVEQGSGRAQRAGSADRASASALAWGGSVNTTLPACRTDVLYRHLMRRELPPIRGFSLASVLTIFGSPQRRSS